LGKQALLRTSSQATWSSATSFAWEGAIAVASSSEAGMIGSHRFDDRFIYQRTMAEIDVALGSLVLPERGRGCELIRASVAGLRWIETARSRSSGLRTLEIPLPEVVDQRQIVAPA
jgi:hypothetical protein